MPPRPIFRRRPSITKLKTPAPNLLGSIAVGNRFLHDKLGILLAGSYQNTHRGSNSLFYDSEAVDTLRGEALTKMSERQYSEQQIRYGLHSKIDYRFNDKHKIQFYNAFMNLTNVQVRDVKSTQLTIGGYDPVAGKCDPQLLHPLAADEAADIQQHIARQAPVTRCASFTMVGRVFQSHQ